jgi:hypothetical protein
MRQLSAGVVAWSWRGFQELWDSHEIVGGCRKREHEAHTRGSTVPCLAYSHRLDVAEAFFD